MAKRDYSELEKEDLVKIIEKLESRKKYGLVWDEERTKEQFEKESENALPVLKEVKGKEIKTDSSKPNNILIEGDNYHALSVLNYTHAGKVDVIYIDPPYNTGNEDFRYNDSFVEKEDVYRHSKWLSFISKRLKLSKHLLHDAGVIFISIDDNEQAQLKMLCNDIFGEENFITQFIWRRSGTGGLRGIFPITTHEYILAYAKDKLSISNKWFSPYSEDSRAAFKSSDERGEYKTQALYLTSLKYVDSQAYFIELPDGTRAKPPVGKGSWRYIESTYRDELKNGNILFKKVKSSPLVLENGSRAAYNLYTKQYISTDGTNPPSMLPDDIVGQTRAAKAELKGIFGLDVFDYAKPSSLIKYLIDLVGTPKNAVILDFFAGTGTAGDAVLQINNNDAKSKRSFILCTNNEENICTDICFPRIQKAIEGYKDSKGEKIEGLGGNLKYFKTAFVKKSVNKDELKIRIARKCTEMLCLREGIFDEVVHTDDYKIFSQGGKLMAVYYSIERGALKNLKKELDAMAGEKLLYCFTLDPLGLDKEDFSAWVGVRLEPIPQKILDIYTEIYEY